jgi:uncharacterized protein involved in exopolysaccharide biosynthesis
VRTTVDAQDYARVLRRRWRVVALGTAIGVLLAIAATLLATPIYAARIKLFVSAQEAGGDSGSNPYQLGLLSQQRVTSYADLVSGPSSPRVWWRICVLVSRQRLCSSTSRRAHQSTRSSSMSP